MGRLTRIRARAVSVRICNIYLPVPVHETLSSLFVKLLAVEKKRNAKTVRYHPATLTLLLTTARRLAVAMAPITRRAAAAKAAGASQRAMSTQKLPTSFKASKSNGISKARHSKKDETGKKGAVRKLTKALEEGIDDSAPTPSNARPIALLSEAATLKHPVSPKPAFPTAIDAPLTETEAVIAYASADDQALPGTPKLPIHNRDILKQAHVHLIKHAPKLAPLIEEHTCTLFTEEGLAEVVDPFQSLASGIISQQVSGAAARSIKACYNDSSSR
jgi:DNA-3-methyladenine glycosylase II